MKRYRAVIQQEITELICDGCGLEAHVNERYEFCEFISIEHKCGYGAIHGDGNKLSIDLCQQCFSDMCGDTLSIISLLEYQAPKSREDTLEYQNIFQARTKSKQEANELKQESDNKISVSEILSANQISSPMELKAALKRVEQLWDVQFQSTEGSELHQLADLICSYEQKDWNSYFEEVPLADDDFMPERFNFESKFTFDENEATAKGMLSSLPINTEVDDESSRDSALAENSPKQYLLESINKAMNKYPELRLGQLLIDVMNFQQPCPELFDIEDNELADKFNQSIGK